MRQALEDSRANNLAVEKLFTPYIWSQEMVLHLFSVLILAASVGLCLTGAMSLANALMAVIVSFLIFSQIQSAGSGRVRPASGGSSIDHANQWTTSLRWTSAARTSARRATRLYSTM